MISDKVVGQVTTDNVSGHRGDDGTSILLPDSGIGLQGVGQVTDQDPRLATAPQGGQQGGTLLTGRDIQRHLPGKVPLAQSAVFDGRAVSVQSSIRADSESKSPSFKTPVCLIR